MLYSEQPLQTFRLRNFKAVRDSRAVKFTPLTVFIGNNGSGKSSLIEGLETFQSIVVDGLDEAMNRWRGFEFVWNAMTTKPEEMTDDLLFRSAVEMDLAFASSEFSTSFAVLPQSQELIILHESYRHFVGEYKRGANSSKKKLFSTLVRDWEGYVRQVVEENETDAGLLIRFDRSLLSNFDDDEGVERWQFLNLSPELMGEPRLTKQSPQARRVTWLAKNGDNIADYLHNIRQIDESAFEGIVETLRYVLPYADKMNPALASELGRSRYLQLEEGSKTIPGWMLSTGTLRVLAILAVLRHPDPPPLLCIEEIENGLDPRTLNLIVEEIARTTQSGKTQVVCTTHSPYFLDLVPLSSIVVVERDASGQPTFTRPDEKALGEWATKFAPGQLYTMSQLTRD